MLALCELRATAPQTDGRGRHHGNQGLSTTPLVSLALSTLTWAFLHSHTRTSARVRAPPSAGSRSYTHPHDGAPDIRSASVHVRPFASPSPSIFRWTPGMRWRRTAHPHHVERMAPTK